MEISLPPECVEIIAKEIREGNFETDSAVVAYALRVMRSVQKSLPVANDELRREIDLGLRDFEEGRVGEWDFEDTKRRLIERMKAKKAS